MKKTERSKPSAGRTSRASYRRHPMSLVQRIAVTASAVITFAILVALLAYILIMGVPNLKPSLFAWHYTSDNCSMTPAIINTLIMVVLSLLLSVPFGIGAAIYLVEYAKRGNKLVKVVRLTAETLSGIPSIVYGLFGYLMFVIALNMDKSMLAGALTLAIMVLPTILRTTEEALKAVPDSFREGSFGLGAGKLRTVFRIVLPSAVPGIFSGIILAIGRIVGESAALLYTAGFGMALVSLFDSLHTSSATLTVALYVYATEGGETALAFSIATILMVLTLLINLTAGIIGRKLKRK